MGIDFDEFLRRCLDEGYRIISRTVKEWKERRNSDEHSIDLIRSSQEFARARAERIAIEGRAATLNFLAYEVFCRVGTKLMAYSGARSTALDLQRKLKESSIEFDISAGELAEFNALADRYLFRKKRDKKEAAAR